MICAPRVFVAPGTSEPTNLQWRVKRVVGETDQNEAPLFKQDMTKTVQLDRHNEHPYQPSHYPSGCTKTPWALMIMTRCRTYFSLSLLAVNHLSRNAATIATKIENVHRCMGSNFRKVSI